MIRVMVVNPVTLVSDITADALKQEKDVRVIDQVASANEALARLGNGNCDVVVISTALPNNSALRLTKAIYQLDGDIKTIIVGLKEERTLVLEYVAAGAAGYVTDDEAFDTLLKTIRAAAEKKAYIPPAIAMSMIKRITELSKLCRPARASSAGFSALTKREQEILSYLAQGNSNQDIADSLILQVGTVKNHVHNILKKLNVRDRKEAANVYLTLTGSANAAAASNSPQPTLAYM